MKETMRPQIISKLREFPRMTVHWKVKSQTTLASSISTLWRTKETVLPASIARASISLDCNLIQNSTTQMVVDIPSQMKHMLTNHSNSIYLSSPEAFNPKKQRTPMRAYKAVASVLQKIKYSVKSISFAQKIKKNYCKSILYSRVCLLLVSFHNFLPRILIFLLFPFLFYLIIQLFPLSKAKDLKHLQNSQLL